MRRGERGATDGGMKVLIMAYGSDSVFVFATRRSVFTQRKAIRGARRRAPAYAFPTKLALIESESGTNADGGAAR